MSSALRYFDGSLSPLADAVLPDSLSLSGSFLSITIVGRGYYRESIKWYPIENKRELAKLVRLDNAGKRFSFRLGEMENGKTPVNLWVFDDAVPASAVLLPETVVLAQNSEGRVTTFISGGETCFLSSKNGQVFSQFRHGLLDSVERFKDAHGLQPDIDSIQLSQTDLNQVILSGIRQLPMTTWARFFQQPDVSRETIATHLRLGVASVIAVCSLYLATTSAYLYWQGHHYQNKLDAHAPNLSSLLNTQSQLGEGQQRLQQFGDYFSERSPFYLFWTLYPELAGQARINRLSQVGGRVILAGETEKVTDLMEFLNGKPSITALKLDNPVQKTRGRERFVMSFVLTDTGREATDGE